MNGGAPTTTPLRALRHAPVLVDDLGALPRLAAAAAIVATNAADADELTRWTRAWLVAWQGVLHAANLIGTVDPWTVPVALGEVPTLKGDPQRRRRDAAVATLERAGLLKRSQDRATGRLAESLFTEHRAGLELDWAAAGRACRYEPAALLALRALSELVVPLDTPAPVSLRELADRTGYAQKQMRVALRRLVEAGVLGVSEAAGQAARYRVTDAMLGRGRHPMSAALGPRAVGGAIRPSAIAGDSAPLPPFPSPAGAGGGAPHPGAPESPAPSATGLRVTLNGVTLKLAPGMTVDVSADADGVPHLTILPTFPERK